MSIFSKNEKYQSRSWSEIAFDFFEIFKDRVTYAMERQRARTAKKIIAAILLVIGSVFFLNGLADFIGEIINGRNWSGYMLVGALLIIVGMFFVKKD